MHRNRFTLAGLMTAPMVLIELLLMGGMYENERFNAATEKATASMLLMLMLA